MMKSLNVLETLNIFMINDNNSNMKLISTLIIYLLLNSIFIVTQFLDVVFYSSIILFIIYCIMIQQYYHINYKIIELKDFIFSICFNVLVFCIFLLFEFKLSYNEIIILFTVSYISIIFYASQLRNQWDLPKNIDKNKIFIKIKVDIERK